MKQITPTQIWSSGSTKDATSFNLQIISDNLIDSATFLWSMSSEDGQQLASGNLSISGEDYEEWDTNDYAWNYAAEKLNLTFI